MCILRQFTHKPATCMLQLRTAKTLSRKEDSAYAHIRKCITTRPTSSTTRCNKPDVIQELRKKSTPHKTTTRANLRCIHSVGLDIHSIIPSQLAHNIRIVRYLILTIISLEIVPAGRLSRFLAFEPYSKTKLEEDGSKKKRCAPRREW